ncbi:MAG: hypothetical protein ROO73_05135 [Roseivirga sp.]
MLKLWEAIMTAAQQLRQEGRQEGIQVRNLEIARNMFHQLHLDTDAIQRVTGLSREALERLQKEE